MKRYFLDIQFKGTHFHGWQVQPNAITVQEELEKAMSLILQQKIAVMGAGRTDTGVHAKLMVAHFEYEGDLEKDPFMFKLNGLLHEGISVDHIRQVALDFHARFSALSRTYHYHLHQNKNPFLTDSSHRYSRKLDFKAMNKAAKHLLGKYDFSCFSKSNTQTFTNDCIVEKAAWKQKDEYWIFEIKANRFLRNMVRAIVGTLIEVGEGKRKSETIVELIRSKNRSEAGASAPAKGLYLVDVEYPEEGFIQ